MGERSHGVALPRALPWFPAVGALVGLVVGAVAAVGAAAVDPLTGAALAVTLGALMTGGLHEDGLADTADGFGGGWTAEQRLTIMDDPRQGTFGVLAIVASVAVRVAALAHLAGDRTGPATAWTVVLVSCVVHLAARGWAVAALVSTPPARGDGLGRTAGAGGPHLGLTLALAAWAVAAVVLTGPATGAATLAAGAAAAVAVVALARRKIGGLTGDVAGAVEQLAEMTALVAAAAVGGPGHPWLAGLW